MIKLKYGSDIMLKKVVGLFIILGSITFAQWEKEYVKNELGQPTDIYYTFM